MKKKPQTIADLKINWTFDNNFIDYYEQLRIFNLLNPTLIEIEIKPGKYFFHWNSHRIEIYEGVKCKLFEFIWDLGYYLRTEIDSSDNLVLKNPLQLNNFKLISENTFQIHEKV